MVPVWMGAIFGGLTGDRVRIPVTSAGSVSYIPIRLKTKERETPEQPVAWVKYKVYDKGGKLLTEGEKAITRKAREDGSGKEHQHLEMKFAAPDSGFVEVWIAGVAEPAEAKVYFDDYGIYLQSASAIANKHPYLYNGKEFQSDFDLNWTDYGARMYDAGIGRWGSVDALAASYENWSIYNFSLNNAIRFYDADGYAPVPVETMGGNPLDGLNVAKSRGWEDRVTVALPRESYSDLWAVIDRLDAYQSKIERETLPDGTYTGSDPDPYKKLNNMRYRARKLVLIYLKEAGYTELAYPVRKDNAKSQKIDFGDANAVYKENGDAGNGDKEQKTEEKKDEKKKDSYIEVKKHNGKELSREKKEGKAPSKKEK